MRFIVDEGTGPAVASWLKDNGHEVFSVYDEARGMSDNDKDFGEMVHRDRRLHRGVILLRLEAERSASKIRVLSRLLESYSDRISETFLVVTEQRVRFANR